jgi:hypothetical protein
MPIRNCCLVLISALAFIGCKKGSCPEGAYKHEKPGFCVKLPSTMKPNGPRPIDSLGWTRLDIDGPVGITVEWTASEDNYQTVMKGTDNRGTKTGGGEMPGKGKWRSYTEDDRVGLVSIVRSGEYTISCSASYEPSEPKPEYLEACKNLRPL